MGVEKPGADQLDLVSEQNGGGAKLVKPLSTCLLPWPACPGPGDPSVPPDPPSALAGPGGEAPGLELARAAQAAPGSQSSPASQWKTPELQLAGAS